MFEADHHQNESILGAMRQEALANGRPLALSDTESLVAAARSLLPGPRRLPAV
jgi:hypothetical protein